MERKPENFPLELGAVRAHSRIHGTQMRASLDGKAVLDYTLEELVSGKVGPWVEDPI